MRDGARSRSELDETPLGRLTPLSSNVAEHVARHGVARNERAAQRLHAVEPRLDACGAVGVREELRFAADQTPVEDGGHGEDPQRDAPLAAVERTERREKSLR